MKKKTISCKKGHPRTKENTYVRSDGYSQCRVCSRIRAQEYKKRIPKKIKARAKEYYLENKDRIKKRARKYNSSTPGQNQRYLQRYGISLDDYTLLLGGGARGYLRHL